MKKWRDDRDNFKNYVHCTRYVRSVHLYCARQHFGAHISFMSPVEANAAPMGSKTTQKRKRNTSHFLCCLCSLLLLFPFNQRFVRPFVIMSFSQDYLLADQGQVDSSLNNNDVIASSCLTSSSADASVYSSLSSTKANLNLSRLPPKKRSGQPKLSQDYFEDTDNESDSDDELNMDHPGRDQQDHSIVRRRRLDSSSSSSSFLRYSTSSPRRNKELELATKEEEEYLPRRVKSCDSSSSKKTKKTCKKKHPRKTRRYAKKQPKKSKTGRWTIDECKAFLIGLQKHGKGKWSKIAKDIPTR
jgi:Myb-like DNA-binding domain.